MADFKFTSAKGYSNNSSCFTKALTICVSRKCYKLLAHLCSSSRLESLVLHEDICLEEGNTSADNKPL